MATAGGKVKGIYLVEEVDYAVEQHETQYQNYTTAGTGPYKRPYNIFMLGRLPSAD